MPLLARAVATRFLASIRCGSIWSSPLRSRRRLVSGMVFGAMPAWQLSRADLLVGAERAKLGLAVGAACCRRAAPPRSIRSVR
jgi:hypothetical protein